MCIRDSSVAVPHASHYTMTAPKSHMNTKNCGNGFQITLVKEILIKLKRQRQNIAENVEPIPLDVILILSDFFLNKNYTTAVNHVIFQHLITVV